MIIIVTTSELEHEVAVEVAVKVNTVVVVMFTVVGSSIKASTSSADGIQLYVNGPVPVIVASIEVTVPYGIVASRPASTIGIALTVTTT